MEPHATRTIYGYGAAGLLPFIGLSVAAYFELGDAVASVSQDTLLIGMVSYGAVILSFLAGTLWMNGVRRASRQEPAPTPSTYSGWPALGALWCSAGICLSLTAWVAVLLAVQAQDFATALLVNALGFGVMLALEWIQRKALDYATGYWRMRCALTVVVLSCHMIAVAAVG